MTDSGSTQEGQDTRRGQPVPMACPNCGNTAVTFRRWLATLSFWKLQCASCHTPLRASRAAIITHALAALYGLSLVPISAILSETGLLGPLGAVAFFVLAGIVVPLPFEYLAWRRSWFTFSVAEASTEQGTASGDAMNGPRARGPLVRMIAILCVAAGLGVALPINNTVEYWSPDTPVGPLGMVRGVVELLLLLFAVAWYAAIWPRVQKGVWHELSGHRLLLAGFIWTAIAYVWLWWLISSSTYLSETIEHTGVMLLALAAPTLIFYLLRSARKHRTRYKTGKGETIRGWLWRVKWRILAVLGGLAAVLLAGLLYFIMPLIDARDLMMRGMREKIDPADMRACCHRVVSRMPWAGHDCYITLSSIGDETSVPILIKALSWAPEEKLRVCTWGHCVEALCAITNQNPGNTDEAWRQWYEQNRGKTRLEWIADGCRAHGLELTAEASEENVRALLAVLGKNDYTEYAKPEFDSPNVRVLLESYSTEPVERVLKDSLKDGSSEQKRGALRYMAPSWKATDDSLARPLLADSDRTVRLIAGGLLLREIRSRVTNPQGALVAKIELGVRANSRAAITEDGRLYLPVRRDTILAYDTRGRAEMWRFSVDNGRGWGFEEPLIHKGRIYSALSGGGLYCLDANTGAQNWYAECAGADEGFERGAPNVR